LGIGSPAAELAAEQARDVKATRPICWPTSTVILHREHTDSLRAFLARSASWLVLTWPSGPVTRHGRSPRMLRRRRGAGSG